MMDDTSKSFDPYQQWLEIPPEDQPPTCYRLLGLDDFETDLEAIDEAAKRRTAFLHQIASGPNRKEVQKLLSEVATARRRLLNEESKAVYDQELRNPEGEVEQELAPLIQVATADSSGVASKSPGRRTSTQRQGEGPRKRRKKSWLDDWRIHALSATTLLFIAVVAVIVSKYSDGGRRASQPGAVADAPGGNSMEAAAAANARSTSAAQPGAIPRGRLLAASDTSTPTTNRRSLLDDLDGKFDPVEPAKSTPQTTSMKDSLSLKLNRSKWLAGLQSQDVFSASFGDQFEIKPDDADHFVVRDGKLILKASAGDPKTVTLISKSLVLKAGDAVVIDSNIRKGLPGNARVGLALGKLRLRVDSIPGNNVAIRAAGRSGNLGLLASGKNQPVTLLINRDANRPEVFDWVATSGNRNIAGRVKLDALAGVKEIPLGIFFSPPSKNVPGDLWVHNLRIGKLKQPPDLKQAREIPVQP